MKYINLLKNYHFFLIKIILKMKILKYLFIQKSNKRKKITYVKQMKNFIERENKRNDEQGNGEDFSIPTS